MQLAGLEGHQVVLLLEDYQFVHPAFLEMVNSLLSSGVLSLFLCNHIAWQVLRKHKCITVTISTWILIICEIEKLTQYAIIQLSTINCDESLSEVHVIYLFQRAFLTHSQWSLKLRNLCSTFSWPCLYLCDKLKVKFQACTHQKSWSLFSPLWKILPPRMDSMSRCTTTSHTVSFCIWFLLLCLFVLVRGWLCFCRIKSILLILSKYIVSPLLLHCFTSTTARLQVVPLSSDHVVFFRSGIQQNLHIVLIMDCSNSNFTINCESNPAFYRKCSVQWMEGWTESSMKKVRGQRY